MSNREADKIVENEELPGSSAGHANLIAIIALAIILRKTSYTTRRYIQPKEIESSFLRHFVLPYKDLSAQEHKYLRKTKDRNNKIQSMVSPRR